MFSTIITAAVSVIHSFAHPVLPEKPILEFRSVRYGDVQCTRAVDTTHVRVYANYIVVKRTEKRYNDTIFVINKEIRYRKYDSWKTDKEKFLASEEIRNYNLDMQSDYKAGKYKAGKVGHASKRIYKYNDKKQVIEIITKNPADNNISGTPDKFTWYADSVVRISNGYKKTVIYAKKKDFTDAAAKTARPDLTLYYTAKSDTGYVMEAIVGGMPETRSRSWKVDEHGIVKTAYDTQTKNGETKRMLLYSAKTEYLVLPKTKLSPEMKKALSLACVSGSSPGSFEKGDGLIEFPVKFD